MPFNAPSEQLDTMAKVNPGAELKIKILISIQES